MPRIRAWGLAAAATVGLSSPTLAGDPTRPPTTLAAKLFGPSKPKPGPTVRPPLTITAPLTADVLAAALDAEQKAWERRVSVCDKLKTIALETNDDALMRQAEDLERQATALYNARVAALGIPKAKEPSEPIADRGSSDAMKTATKKLMAPAAPSAVDTAVRTAEARTPGDVIREVRP